MTHKVAAESFHIAGISVQVVDNFKSLACVSLGNCITDREKVILTCHACDITDEAKLDELKLKRDLLAEVKNRALSKLLEAPEKRLIGIFEKNIKESGLSGEFTLIPSVIHKKIIEKNLASLEKAGAIKIKIADTDASISSGFLLSSDIYDVDFTLDAIVEECFTNSEKVIYDILFESGEGK